MHRGMLLIVWTALGLIGAPLVSLAAPRDPAGFIFVASPLDPTIAIVDSASDAVVSRIRLPGAPRQVAVLNRGLELVASDAAARRLYIVDAVNGTMKRELETSVSPVLLQTNRTGTLLAVADPEAGTVEFIRPSGGTAIPVPGLAGLRSIAFAPDGRLLVALGTRIAVIDAATGGGIAEMSADVRDGPIAQVATDPGGEYVFAVHADRGALTVFELKTLTRTARLQFPAPLGRLLPSADSQFVVLPVAGGRALSVISTWTLKESARFPMSAQVSGLGLGMFQSVSIGLSRTSRILETVDLRDQRRLARLAMPGVPETGAVSPDGLTLYVALSDAGRVAVVDLRHATIRHVIEDVVPGAATVVSALGNSYCH